MANNYPYEQWYWEDWFTDTSFLSPMAKYVWFQVLGVMWTKGRLATLTQMDDEFCRFLGIEKSVFDKAVTELSRDCHGRVTKSDGFTTFYSKRRDNDNRERCLSTERKRNERANKKSVTELSRDCHADVTGHTRAYPLTINHKYPSLNPAPVVAGREGPREGRGGEGDSEGYPSSAAEVMEAASASGYRLSKGQSAEWLRMKQADGWKDSDGRPIVSWRRLLSSWCQSSGVQTEKAYEEQLEREARRQEAERQRRIAERKAADEAKASIKKLDVSQALALMKL